MRKYSILLFLILGSLPVKSQVTGESSVSVKIDSTTSELYKGSHALLIGVSNYTYNWPALPEVKKDMQLLKEALELHGFSISIVENPNRVELDKAVSDFISKYGQKFQNRLLIYFAGHGHTLITNYGEELGYVIPSDTPAPDTDLSGFKRTAVPMSLIEIWAKQIESKHALFIFDACFSGTLFSMSRAMPGAISYKTTNPVRQFITSGSANEVVPDQSIFRKEFITAITTDYADANKDGYLTGSELGEYLQTNVANYSFNRQHPQYGKIRDPYLDKGDFVFLLKNNITAESDQAVSIPKILRTEKLDNYIFHGMYMRIGTGFTGSGSNTKLSLFYSSKLLNYRYCFGLEGNYLRADYIQTSETFPNLYQTYSDNPYEYLSLSLYNRLYLFPQNRSIVNLYAGASISWNDWQFELGLRPYLSKKLMIELSASYLMHNGEINYYQFNPYGNPEIIPMMHLFQGFYFGFNIVYFKQFL